MMFRKVIIFYLVFILSFLCSSTACIAANAPALELTFPYRLSGGESTVAAGSVNPLYIAVSGGFEQPKKMTMQIQLPPGMLLASHAAEGWENGENDQGTLLTQDVTLNAGYDSWFSLLYLQSAIAFPEEDQTLVLTMTDGKDVWRAEQTFHVRSALSNDAAGLSWRVQRMDAPVDHHGDKDVRQADGVVYLRDNLLEDLRSRLIGQGNADWASIDRHPFTNVALYVENPSGSRELVRIKAELRDEDDHLMPGLGTVVTHPTDDESANAEVAGNKDANAEYALMALDGSPLQKLVLPLHGDTGRFPAGAVTLRLILSGATTQQSIDLPLQLVVRRQGTLAALSVTTVALFLLGCFLWRFGARLFQKLGARGVITIALFGALSFGSITIPTTLAGDLLHVFLGPLSPLVSGLLSGVLMYLFLLALNKLYPFPGVISLMLLLKWLLTAVVFGRLSLIGIGGLAFHAALLESVLWLTGRTRGSQFSLPLWSVALACGITDTAVTYVNLELMIFFYRLFYADWYIGLYVLINGLLYSSLGAWLGSRVGDKLLKVTGE